MPANKRSAAVALQAAPESAEPFLEEFDAARLDAGHAAASLASACADPSTPPDRLIQAADRALEAAGRLRGMAAMAKRAG